MFILFYFILKNKHLLFTEHKTINLQREHTDSLINAFTDEARKHLLDIWIVVISKLTAVDRPHPSDRHQFTCHGLDGASPFSVLVERLSMLKAVHQEPMASHWFLISSWCSIINTRGCSVNTPLPEHLLLTTNVVFNVFTLFWNETQPQTQKGGLHWTSQRNCI